MVGAQAVDCTLLAPHPCLCAPRLCGTTISCTKETYLEEDACARAPVRDHLRGRGETTTFCRPRCAVIQEYHTPS
eukprot:15480130-Alexandrium_andersonii.AAC.1